MHHRPLDFKTADAGEYEPLFCVTLSGSTRVVMSARSAASAIVAVEGLIRSGQLSGTILEVSPLYAPAPEVAPTPGPGLRRRKTDH